MVEFQAISLSGSYNFNNPSINNYRTYILIHRRLRLSPPNSTFFIANDSSKFMVSGRNDNFYQMKRKTSTLFSSSSTTASTDSSPPPPSQSPLPNQHSQRKGTDLQTLARRFWKVAAPYWYSDDKVQARLQLAAVFALTLGTTGISVGFNFLGRDFYNALAIFCV